MPISDAQLSFNQALHQSDPSFGNREHASGLATNLPLALLRMHESGLCSSVLDYGTGKGLLVKRLRNELPDTIRVEGYDPAVLKWSNKPQENSDILLCLDVLEHVELDLIDDVINDIKSLTSQFCYLVIDLKPAVKRLADGRNAHVLLAPPEWWISKFSHVFLSLTSFVLPHQNGSQQKLVIVASKSPKVLPYMYSFLNKLNLYDMCFKSTK